MIAAEAQVALALYRRVTDLADQRTVELSVDKLNCADAVVKVKKDHVAFLNPFFMAELPDGARNGDVFNKNRDVLEIVKKESAKKANLEAIANGIDMGMDLNITNQLGNLDNPTLILAGREDDLISIDLINILKDNIKNSKVIIFDEINHNLLIGENISKILKLIRQFI